MWNNKDIEVKAFLVREPFKTKLGLGKNSLVRPKRDRRFHWSWLQGMCTTGCNRPQFQLRRSCRCLHLPSYTYTYSITSPIIVYRIYLENKFGLSLLLTLFHGSFHRCHHCKMCIPQGKMIHSCRRCPPCPRWLDRCNMPRWCPLWAGPACDMVLVVLSQCFPSCLTGTTIFHQKKTLTCYSWTSNQAWARFQVHANDSFRPHLTKN